MQDTKTSEPMNQREYVIDETFRRIKNNQLLDKVGSGINHELTQQGELALAAIAAAVHEHARYLTPAQAELAVKWLKKWKLRDSVPADLNDLQAADAFWQKLEGLKSGTEQVQLQRVATKHAAMSRVWAVAFALLLALVVGLVVSGAGGGWWVLAAVGAGASLIASEHSMVKAMVAAKEQDRRYLLQSIRASNTVSEMLNAGICAYIPGVLYDGPSYDERYAKRQMAEERERLTDALYSDPDNYLDPYGYRDPGPRV